VDGSNGATTSITLRDTILSANSANGAPENCRSPLTSGGGNVEDTSPSQCGLGAGDRIGVDPLLGPLAANGGPTLTQRPLTGSPALDAGVACAATDQRGVARPQGAACDSGAYELAPPVPVTGDAGSVTTTSATLNATLANPALFAGSAQFQVGTTTSYGSATAAQPAGAQSTQALSAALAGLKPGTLYHYRLVASNPEGTSAGADRTFTTLINPELTKLAVSPKNVLAFTGHGPSFTSRKRGATVTYSDSLASTTIFTVQASRKGFRAGKRCRVKRPSGKKRAKRCKFFAKAGSFKRTDSAGRNSFRFTGRVKHRPLKPGSYRLEAVASKDGLKSAMLHASFRIVN
jgi:hypothetical protein